MKPHITIINDFFAKEHPEVQIHKDGTTLEITSNITKAAVAILRENGLDAEAEKLRNLFVYHYSNSGRADCKEWDLQKCIELISKFLNVDSDRF